MGQPFRRVNSQSIWVSPSAVRMAYSDASSTGYGGYIVEHGSYVACGQWTQVEAVKSSIWRELRAVELTLQSLLSYLSGHRVKWFTDNQNVAHLLLVGSRKPELQAGVFRIFCMCFYNRIVLEPQWVPREENTIADELSRIIDYDDWQLNPGVFSLIDSHWGPHTVDWFAAGYNSQLDRFNSHYAVPGTEAVDAFTVHWGGENNWWCPPLCLVPRVLRHARACAAQGTLIVPLWPSAPFWPLLCLNGCELAAFVVDLMGLPLFKGLFLPGRSGAVLFNGAVPNSDVLAVRIDFGQQAII